MIGIATYYEVFSIYLGKLGIWVDDLFIYESYRKEGVGKALIQKLC